MCVENPRRGYAHKKRYRRTAKQTNGETDKPEVISQTDTPGIKTRWPSHKWLTCSARQHSLQTAHSSSSLRQPSRCKRMSPSETRSSPSFNVGSKSTIIDIAVTSAAARAVCGWRHGVISNFRFSNRVCVSVLLLRQCSDVCDCLLAWFYTSLVCAATLEQFSLNIHRINGSMKRCYKGNY